MNLHCSKHVKVLCPVQTQSWKRHITEFYQRTECRLWVANWVQSDNTCHTVVSATYKKTVTSFNISNVAVLLCPCSPCGWVSVVSSFLYSRPYFMSFSPFVLMLGERRKETFTHLAFCEKDEEEPETSWTAFFDSRVWRREGWGLLDISFM